MTYDQLSRLTLTIVSSQDESIYASQTKHVEEIPRHGTDPAQTHMKTS